jgi:hypothetical protein
VTYSCKISVETGEQISCKFYEGGELNFFPLCFQWRMSLQHWQRFGLLGQNFGSHWQNFGSHWQNFGFIEGTHVLTYAKIP